MRIDNAWIVAICTDIDGLGIFRCLSIQDGQLLELESTVIWPGGQGESVIPYKCPDCNGHIADWIVRKGVFSCPNCAVALCSSYKFAFWRGIKSGAITCLLIVIVGFAVMGIELRSFVPVLEVGVFVGVVIGAAVMRLSVSLSRASSPKHESVCDAVKRRGAGRG